MTPRRHFVLYFYSEPSYTPIPTSLRTQFGGVGEADYLPTSTLAFLVTRGSRLHPPGMWGSARSGRCIPHARGAGLGQSQTCPRAPHRRRIGTMTPVLPGSDPYPAGQYFLHKTFGWVAPSPERAPSVLLGSVHCARSIAALLGRRPPTHPPTHPLSKQPAHPMQVPGGNRLRLECRAQQDRLNLGPSGWMWPSIRPAEPTSHSEHGRPVPDQTGVSVHHRGPPTSLPSACALADPVTATRSPPGARIGLALLALAARHRVKRLAIALMSLPVPVCVSVFVSRGPVVCSPGHRRWTR